MAAATNEQIQRFVNERFRPWAEAMRAVYLQAKDHRASLDDVYEALNGANTWDDNRSDGPPHLLSDNDVLAWNTFMANLITFIEGQAEWSVVLKACVRGV